MAFITGRSVLSSVVSTRRIGVTLAKVTPIRRVETTELSTERPVMNAIRERLTAITEGRDPAYEHWVSRVRLDG